MSSVGPAKFSLFGIQPRDGRRELILSLARAPKSLSAADVRQLRRAMFEDEVVTREEASAFFELDRAQNQPCQEWVEFFVECLTDHVVWQARPTGILSQDQAGWLLAEADRNGSLASFALLANVLAESQRAPQDFVESVRLRARAPAVQAALAQAAAR
jgi:hypothetical protein